MTYTHLNTHLIFVACSLDIYIYKKPFDPINGRGANELSSCNYVYGEVVSNEN